MAKPNRTRNNGVLIYLNDQELALLDKKLAKSHLRSRSAYIRELITYEFVYTVDYSYISEYSYQLSQIGKNINQIAHKVNSTNSVTENDMKKLKNEWRKLWQSFESMESKVPLINQ